MFECNAIDFRTHISETDEFNYGDFLRSANSSLVKLRKDIASIQDTNINSRLDKMQNYLQFAPNWNIGLTRICLFQDIQYIIELLYAHNQDWESDYRSLDV